MKDIEIHAHLWYVEESKELISKLSSSFRDRINLSLVKDSEGNQEILDFANQNFNEVKAVFVDNMGNDQNGFIESYKNNSEDKPWVLYVHDKKDSQWTNDLVDPILSCKHLDIFLNEDNIGIIGAKTKLKDIETEEYLASRDKEVPFEDKKDIVKYRHAITWLRELQYILFTEYGFIKEEDINFKFFAGTMFLARRSVIELAHMCIHKSFFEPRYSANGKVEHGLERFYGYVSLCLELEVKGI